MIVENKNAKLLRTVSVRKDKKMSGTKVGGQKAAQKNKELYGSDFYKKIGAKGGKKSTTGGFAANPELAREAGRKGGKISKRGKARSK